MKRYRNKKGRFARKPRPYMVRVLVPLVYGGILTGMYVAFIANAAVDPKPIIVEQPHEWEPRTILIGTEVDWTREGRIEEEYKRAAEKYGVSFEQMWRTVSECENITLDPTLQSWHPDPTGPNGREDSWGLSQIHLPSNPEVTREQAQDPAFSAEFMAKKFSEGLAHRWTCWRMLYR